MPALKFLIVSIPTILAAYLTIILVFFSDDKDTTSEVILDSLTNKVTGRLSLGNDSLIKLHELSLSEIHSIDDKVDSLSAIESRNKLLKSKEKYFLDIKGDKDGISMLSRYLKESSVTFTNSQKYTIWVDASPSSGFLKLSLIDIIDSLILYESPYINPVSNDIILEHSNRIKEILLR